MSKNFEQSYRELARIEVPDLWDRIEAGLSEKSTLNAESDKSAAKEKTKPAGVLVVLRRYSALAAAAVCIAVLIPAISLIGDFGLGKDKSAEAPAEMAMEESAEAPAGMAMEESAEAPAEMAMEDSAEAPAGMAMEEGAEVFEETNEMTDNSSLRGDAAESYADSVYEAEAPVMAQGAQAKEEKQGAEKEGTGEMDGLLERCPEGTLLSEVSLEVTKVTAGELTVQGTKVQGGFFYASVREDAANLLKEGEQIVVFIPINASLALKEGMAYELAIESFEAEGECYFNIAEWKRMIKE